MSDPTAKQHGFALVLTLALLAVLVLAVFALSLMVRVGTQSVATAAFQAQAKQNALTGLTLAVSQLQEAAGSDSRLTGNAGIAGISPRDTRRQWTGVWGGAISPVWLTSGVASRPTPELPSRRVELVGAKSVGSPTDRTEQETVDAGLVSIPSVSTDGRIVEGGRFAYWVGDEGAKISVALNNAELQLNAAGVGVRPDTRRLLGSSFNPLAAEVERLLSFEQSKEAFSNTSLTGAFHQATLTARFLPASAPGATARAGPFASGVFNINTTSIPAWRAWFEFPSSATTASTYLSLSSSQSLRLAERVATAVAARGGPFAHPSEFVSSGIIDAALNTVPRVTGITEQEILDALAPIWAVRSDTFRIRAYGDALNPADETVQATAYCEAIVQRTPEIMTGAFGRRFVVIYFRWLGPDDI